MKKILNVAMAVAIATTALTGCKKGANDPFLSLKSRKARLKGEWKLTKVEGTETDNNGEKTTITYDGTLWTETNSNGSGSYTYEETVKFDKNGTFTLNTKSTYSSTDFETESTEGQWTFVGKNKDAGLKNKEAIVFSELKYNQSGQYELFGNIETYNSTNTEEGDFAARISNGWVIDKLSSKELIVKMQYSYTDNNGKSTKEYTYTYEKQ